MIMLVRLLLGAAAAIAVMGALFFLGMRSGSPRVRGAVKQMNKRFWNPRNLEDAGTAGSQWSVIRHVGRTSGTAYRTPVGARMHADAFVITMPYGTSTDWLRNLQAADGGEVDHDGTTYPVGTPEVVRGSEVDELLSDTDRRAMKAFNIDEVLRLPIVVA